MRLSLAPKNMFSEGREIAHWEYNGSKYMMQVNNVLFVNPMVQTNIPKYSSDLVFRQHRFLSILK